MAELDIARALLGVALAGVLVASTLLGVDVYQHRPLPEIPQTIDWPPTWAEIQAQRAEERLAEVIQLHERRARQTKHCAHCGRFAANVPDLPGVASCGEHGLTARITYLRPDRIAA